MRNDASRAEPALAVDPSRSTPDTPLVTPPPEAREAAVCARCGKARDAHYFSTWFPSLVFCELPRDPRNRKQFQPAPAAPPPAAPPIMPAAPSEAGPGFWFTEDRPCVECEGCGFAFDSEHVNADDGLYSCPVCEAESLRARLAEVERERDEERREHDLTKAAWESEARSLAGRIGELERAALGGTP